MIASSFFAPNFFADNRPDPRCDKRYGGDRDQRIGGDLVHRRNFTNAAAPVWNASLRVMPRDERELVSDPGLGAQQRRFSVPSRLPFGESSARASGVGFTAGARFLSA